MEKPNKRLRRAIRLGKRAKRLYVSGMNTEEIAKELGRSKITINRYYILAGGITLDDRAKHKKNRSSI